MMKAFLFFAWVMGALAAAQTSNQCLQDTIKFCSELYQTGPVEHSFDKYFDDDSVLTNSGVVWKGKTEIQDNIRWWYGVTNIEKHKCKILSVDEASGTVVFSHHVWGTWSTTGAKMNNDWLVTARWTALRKFDFLDFTAMDPAKFLNGYMTNAEKASQKLLKSWLSGSNPVSLSVSDDMLNLVSENVDVEIVSFPALSNPKWSGKQGLVDAFNELSSMLNLTTKKLKHIVRVAQKEVLHANSTDMIYRVALEDRPIEIGCLTFNEQGLLTKLHMVLPSVISIPKLWAIGANLGEMHFTDSSGENHADPSVPVVLPSTESTGTQQESQLLQQVCAICRSQCERAMDCPQMCSLCIGAVGDV